MRRTRREYLAGTTGTLALLAGCTGGSSNTVSTPDLGSSEDNELGEYKEWFDQTVTIEEGSYLSWEIAYEQEWSLQYEFSVTEGPAIDLFLTPKEEFANFKEGSEFAWIGSMDRKSDFRGAGPGAGEYVFVADNSDRGKASPPSNDGQNTAKVDIYTEVR